MKTETLYQQQTIKKGTLKDIILEERTLNYINNLGI